MRTTDAARGWALPPLVSARRPRLTVVWARLRAPRLDRQLSSGAATWRSRAHAERALQLTSDRSRRGLARSLERLIEQSERPPAPFRGAVVQPCREQVREALPEILAIASRLRSGAPVNARGVALLRELLSDGSGPCYAPSQPDALPIALRTVSDMLDVQD